MCIKNGQAKIGTMTLLGSLKTNQRSLQSTSNTIRKNVESRLMKMSNLLRKLKRLRMIPVMMIWR
jgi:hypothetical protein